MIESNFVDYVKIYVRSGKGGRGVTHFRHEKYIPFGGPDGGNGGSGGDIILQGNKNYWTLFHLKYERHFFAESGKSGEGRQKHGKNGKNKIIEVPIGTSVFDAKTEKFITDIKYDKQKIVLLKGGKGGKGNDYFKSATNRTPRHSQLGESYKEKEIIFQLNLLADVGLVGLPNVGKSTLLSVISSAKPKIANYAFTTLSPNLGIVNIHDSCTFTMADIPGIIKGASEGKGLGLRFLRHIERNSLLMFLIASDTNDIIGEYKILLNELRHYNPKLLYKQRILAISKSDMLNEKLKINIKQKLPTDIQHIFISSFVPNSIIALKYLLWGKLNKILQKHTQVL
ncbi:MAG: GTPase ObgE [Bacteroidales bacterium OttesenSCG-928-I14]|jgi:GTP-binding protein|nr:GTPase ObgE [Bacteroidales bacterium OttesenSCG-928-I14]